jgi:hypothetical protein
MRFDGVLRMTAGSVAWQDYRASETGMVVIYDTDPVSEMAIREVPEEFPSEVVADPNYESKTYGLYGCARTKFRSAFVKNKLRYLFFMAHYQGAREEFRGKYFVTGMYRIVKTADVHKAHLRYLRDASCLEEDECIALLSETAQFVALDDALPVTDEMLKQWEYKTRVTRQTRIVLNDSHTRSLVEYLLSKPNAIDKYIAETRRLQPHGTEDGGEIDDSGEQSGGETASVEQQSAA